MSIFDWGTALNIKPMSYGVEQRREAARLATELGHGVRMEVGNTSTHFYTTPAVPVGHIEVWMARTYSGQLEHAVTLKSADEPFEAWGFKWPLSEDERKLKADAFEEALQAVQAQINKNLPITEETVLRVDNPYKEN